MPNKVLVTYASRGGSTAGVADVIGKTLMENGVEVDVRPMQAVNDLTPYRAVVAGSAIRRDQWLPEAMQFMQRHKKGLAQRPFAAFLVCLALATKDEQRHAQAKQNAIAWLHPVREMVNPVSEGLFAGVLDLSTIPEPGYRLLFRLVVSLGLLSEGDYRDWDSIRDWAHSLLTILQETPSGDDDDIVEVTAAASNGTAATGVWN
jgi:menaquinone-dependent protoporphyrinogen oxidase